MEKILHHLRQLNDDKQRFEQMKSIFEQYKVEKHIIPVALDVYFLFVSFQLEQSFDVIQESVQRLNAQHIHFSSEQLPEIIYEHLIVPYTSFFEPLFFRYLTEMQQLQLIQTVQNCYFPSSFTKIYMFRSLMISEEKNNQLQQLGKEPSLMCWQYGNTATFLREMQLNRNITVIYDEIAYLYIWLLFNCTDDLITYLKQQPRLLFIDCTITETLLSQTFATHSLYHYLPDYIFTNTTTQYERVTHHIELAKKEFAYGETFISKSAPQWIAQMQRYGVENYFKNIFTSKTPLRILLCASNRTQTNYYIVQTWAKAFEKLGHEVKLLLERTYHTRNDMRTVFREVMQFRPHIIFDPALQVEERFGHEQLKMYQPLQQHIIYMYRHRDGQFVANNLCEQSHLQFVFPVIEHWQHLWLQREDMKNRVLYFCEGIDTDWFDYVDTMEQQYDIVIVINNNAANYKTTFFKQKFNQWYEYNETVAQMIEAKFIETLVYIENHVQNEGGFLLEPALQKIFSEKLNIEKLAVEITVTTEQLMNLCAEIASYLKIYQILQIRLYDLKALITAGFTNIVLYGARWEDVDFLQPYWKGTVKNGKPLAEVYATAKLALSISPEYTMHERNFEIWASSGCPLVRIDDTIVGEKLTDHFVDDVSMICYHNREQLIEKVQTYLQDDAKRQYVAQQGKQIVQHQFTNVVIAEKALNFIKDYFVK